MMNNTENTVRTVKRQIYLFMAKIALFQRRGCGIKVDATVYVMIILVNEFRIC